MSDTAPLAHATSTIAAIATPVGRGGVGIIRLSGANAHSIACTLTQRSGTTFTPRYATFCRFFDATGQIIDEGLVLYFPAPNSFTGEDVIELQGHGGSLLQNMLLTRLYELGATPAQAGEFSYRAFMNDKLDLVQAEAIADAIDATSQSAVLSAMRSLTGAFSAQIDAMLQALIKLRVYVEAAIDFPDEEDVDFLSDGVIESRLAELQTQVASTLAEATQGQLLRDGIQVVLAGRPNAGKSSLLNRLAGQERAIVTEVAGTTRDTLHETIVIHGLTLHITDTAGLRDTDDVVEQMGIARTQQAIAQADLLLLVYDISIEADPAALAEQLLGSVSDKRLLLVGNKADLAQRVSRETSCEGVEPSGFSACPSRDSTENTNNYDDADLTYRQVTLSCRTGEGIESLKNAVAEMVGFFPSEGTFLARTRHLEALRQTSQALAEAHYALVHLQAGELVAEHLRQAQQALGQITGMMSADALLGEIFSNFCIGK